MVSQTLKGRELANWRVCRHLLFIAVFFGCQLVAQCGPQTLTKTIRNSPNSMSRFTISVDGTDPSSLLKGLDLSGFERVQPGQQSSGYETPQRLGRPGSFQNQRRPGAETPQRLGRQGSGLNNQQSPDFGANPFAGLDDWRKQIEKSMGAMRGGQQNNLGGMGRDQGGMLGKPNQLGKSKSMGSQDDWNVPSYGQQPGANRGGRGGRQNGRNNGGGNNRGRRGANRSGDFHQECLDAHNEYRAKHGVSPLKLSPQLNQLSQEWAEHLANVVGGMQHREDSEYGENIFYKWSSDPSFTVGGREAVDSWYSEIKVHQFGSPSGSSGSGHFTQLIWKSSTELGCGMAKSPDNKIFVVCNYNPAGNMMGDYARNVPPVGGYSKEDEERMENESKQSPMSMGMGDFGDMNQMLGGMGSMFGGF